ncbi:9636_t:CDS:2, partial [Acaulospora morrowiae]
DATEVLDLNREESPSHVELFDVHRHFICRVLQVSHHPSDNSMSVVGVFIGKHQVQKGVANASMDKPIHYTPYYLHLPRYRDRLHCPKAFTHLPCINHTIAHGDTTRGTHQLHPFLELVRNGSLLVRIFRSEILTIRRKDLAKGMHDLEFTNSYERMMITGM